MFLYLPNQLKKALNGPSPSPNFKLNSCTWFYPVIILLHEFQGRLYSLIICGSPCASLILPSIWCRDGFRSLQVYTSLSFFPSILMGRGGGGEVKGPKFFWSNKNTLVRPQLSQPPLTIKNTKFNGIFIPPPPFWKGMINVIVECKQIKIYEVASFVFVSGFKVKHSYYSIDSHRIHLHLHIFLQFSYI